MKRAVVLIAAVAAIYLVYTSCSAGQDDSYYPQFVKIGTWNLEWFGALGRSEEDIAAIAELIRIEQIDLLCLQEITCECTLRQLAEILGYDYFISPQRTPQKLALIWDPEKVKEVVFREDAYNALERVAKHGLGYDSRQPLVFSILAGRFDFTLMNVHLKSIPERQSSVEIRNIQYQTINLWLQQELAIPGGEKDILIAGDFNSYNYGISSAQLLNAGYVSFVTTGLPPNEYSNIWYYTTDEGDSIRNKSLIDHMAVTDALLHGEFEMVHPIRDWDEELGTELFENHYSDHLPLVATFIAYGDHD